jgi:hypothetical protein
MRREQTPAAEVGEGRALAQGKPVEQNRVRPPRRGALHRGLDRRRAAARRARTPPLTALGPQVTAIDRLREADDGLHRDAPAGGDGQTGAADGDNLAADLREWADRRKRGASHASPGERVDIPTPDGRQRPRGMPTRAAKIGQRATVEGLNASAAGDLAGLLRRLSPGPQPT